MEKKWLVIGICGVTCGGKTTLAKEIQGFFSCSKLISQDDYFLPEDSPKHVLVPELNHFNWELLSSLDMEKMHQDVLKILNSTVEFKDLNPSLPTNDPNYLALTQKLVNGGTNILIIEGFSIFSYKPIEQLCDLKFFLSLPRDVCLERRSNRVYNPPDVPGYFDLCVWPEHIKNMKEVRKTVKKVVYLSGIRPNKCSIVMNHLLSYFETHK